MASLRYEMNFGSANAGGAPTFNYFVRQDTGAALSQPTIVEASWLNGAYYFEWDWDTSAATTISWMATLNGVELSGVESSPGLAAVGAATASAATSSLNGYSTVGALINRAAVQCGLSSVDDPFASTDAKFVQFVEYLTSLGTDLLAQHEWGQLIRECTIVTAGSAGSYALPADFYSMINQTGWNRSSTFPLIGPLTGPQTQALKAIGATGTVGVPFRLQGNLLVFPVDPGDGLTITFEYLSDYWIQTAASGTGPDADHPTAATDYVLFDPQLIVYGLKYLWRDGHGMDVSLDLARYEQRLDQCKGKDGGAPVLSLNGGGSGFRFIDELNLPVTGWGL